MTKGKAILIAAGVAVLALVAGGFNWYFYGNVSEGERVGVISKCSLKGQVSKTHECDAFVGAANVAGQTGGAAMGAVVWPFTVRDADWDAGLGATIQQAMDSGTPVKMDYIQPRFTVSWRTDTGYYVIKVAPRATPPAPATPTVQ